MAGYSGINNFETQQRSNNNVIGIIIVFYNFSRSVKCCLVANIVVTINESFLPMKFPTIAYIVYAHYHNYTLS